MDLINWNYIKHFKPSENWGDITQIVSKLVYKLDIMRDISSSNIPFIIHCAYNNPASNKHSKKSYHYKGMAVDGHFDGLSLIQQYLIADKLNWGGLGLYQDTIPWIHCDVRPVTVAVRWGCRIYRSQCGKEINREYCNLDLNFLKDIV